MRLSEPHNTRSCQLRFRGSRSGGVWDRLSPNENAEEAMIEHMFDRTDGAELVERAGVLALVNAAGRDVDWYRIARTIGDVGGALKIIHGEWSGFEDHEARELHEFAAGADGDLDRYSSLIEEQEASGARCVTVLDPDYPINLREIFNRPPFLFVRGQLLPADNRAIAVVGTRDASPDGLGQASRLATALAEDGVTVLSGMARGIDTTAHNAALAAGGRTVAVMGTGIMRRYPAENRHLADQIEANGALVSQFWPDAPPTRYSFPMRNIVTSGLSLGTVVIEASKTSGAKSQARHALEHGKLVFLVRSLVLGEEWARDYVERRGAIAIDDVDDVLRQLVRLSELATVDQLRLS